jgi:crotonobetainyl-CoA:carnitine CoA-transferase CaiB-like acyl-CoA transferase
MTGATMGPGDSDNSRTSGGRRPLDGIRVLDLGTALAGPVCATILGDFGANVIKVERPGSGDPLRTFGPSIDGTPLWWMIEGRNKRSITLDYSRAEAGPLLHALVRESDVIVENFRPGTMERWGFDYPRLRVINPGLVYVSVSGFGQTGPYRLRPAYDRVAQAMAGLTYVTGHPGQPPVKPGIGITDYSTAIVAALGTMLALFERQASAEHVGQHVDVALTESLLRMFHYYVPLFQLTGTIPERVGNSAEAMAPAECFCTRDGVWLMIAAGTDGLFKKLALAIALPELASDERFLTNQERSANQDVLHGIIRRRIGELESGPLRTALEDAGVPGAPLYTSKDIYHDPHFRERGAITPVSDPRLGEVWMQGVVPALTRTPGRIETTGPELGADNEAIYLGELNLSGAEYQALRDAGVI